MALAAVLISAAALVTSIIVALKQHAQGEAAAKTEGRFLAIEETRFQWDQESRAVETAAAAAEDERRRSATFGVRFGFRDSARTWGRLIARNNGPSEATDVTLTVGAVVDGEPVEVEPVGGTDYGSSEVLKPNESVHVGVAFTFGSPGPEDLTYRLLWSDGLGTHEDEGRIPLF